MNTYKVIEGSTWEIQAEGLEEAKAIYEAHFRGYAGELPMKEKAPGVYWYAEGEAELEQARATLDAVAYQAGAVATLEWLSEIYPDIQLTDCWSEHMGQE